MATLYKNITVGGKQYNLKYRTSVKFSTIRTQIDGVALWWDNAKEAETWAAAADIDDLKFTYQEIEITDGINAGKKYSSYRTNGSDSETQRHFSSDITTNYAVSATLI